MTWYYLFLLLLTDSIFRYLLIFLFFIFLLFFLSFFLFTFQVRDWSFGGGVFGYGWEMYGWGAEGKRQKTIGSKLFKWVYAKEKIFQSDSCWGAVVEEVRTAFARINNAIIYTPNLPPFLPSPT